MDPVQILSVGAAVGVATCIGAIGVVAASVAAYRQISRMLLERDARISALEEQVQALMSAGRELEDARACARAALEELDIYRKENAALRSAAVN